MVAPKLSQPAHGVVKTPSKSGGGEGGISAAECCTASKQMCFNFRFAAQTNYTASEAASREGPHQKEDKEQ